MRKTREVLRLRYDAKLSYSNIARSINGSSSTARDVVLRFEASRMNWPLPDDMDDSTLEKSLYRDEGTAPPDAALPNWQEIHKELRSSKLVTLQLLWEEYRQEHPQGYQYSWFAESFARFKATLDPVMRLAHKMGEMCFVDYSGDRPIVIDPDTGEVRPVELFVGVLGGSSYTYAEATWGQDTPNWLGSHVRMFEYFGGVSELLVPDNLKSGVTKPNYYEPDVNISYLELAEHYGTAVLPARVRKPRDKAKVENGVLIAQRWILAALRKSTFYSLEALNEAIWTLLDTRFNPRPFQKLDGSRRSLFVELEKPTLKPLPTTPYEIAEWKKAKVGIDYHFELEKHYYSVAYTLIHQTVEVRYTLTVVEALVGGRRIASHRRSYVKGGHTTLKEHMPPKHAAMLEWTPERLTTWAGKTGPSIAQMVERIMGSKAHPQQGYRACLGVMRLGKKYGNDRLEAACQRALANGASSYRSVLSILEKNLDKQPLEDTAARPPIAHENIRGANYWGEGSERC